MLGPRERFGHEAAMLDQRRAEVHAFQRGIEVRYVLQRYDHVIRGQLAREVGDGLVEPERIGRTIDRDADRLQQRMRFPRRPLLVEANNDLNAGNAWDRAPAREVALPFPRRRRRARRRRTGYGSGRELIVNAVLKSPTLTDDLDAAPTVSSTSCVKWMQRRTRRGAAVGQHADAGHSAAITAHFKRPRRLGKHAAISGQSLTNDLVHVVVAIGREAPDEGHAPLRHSASAS